jgi:hypothetical protein
MIQIDTNLDIFYVYHHINIDNNEVFYVGKGKLDRYKSIHGRSKYWSNYIKSNPNWKSVIIKDKLTEDESFNLEISEIERIGRRIYKKGSLVNILPGGKGFPEHYIVYRDVIQSELSYSNNNKVKVDSRIELYDKIDKFMSKYKDPLQESIDSYLIKNGHKTIPKYHWEVLNEEERLKVILDEYNRFIHNLKLNNKRLSGLNLINNISELSPTYVNKIYNLKDNRYEKKG